MTARGAREKMAAYARVVGAARMLLEPRPSTFEVAGSTFEANDATRCLCGCDPQVEELRRALARFDAVFHEWDHRAARSG